MKNRTPVIPRFDSKRWLGVARDAWKQNAHSLLAGFLGALAAALVMVALRLIWGSPTLPELVGERILPLLSVDLFIKLLNSFGSHPKTGPLGLALLSQFVLGVVLGPLYHKLAQVPDRTAGWWPSRRAWAVAGIFVLAMELIAVILFWPVLSESLVGYPIGTARWLTILSALLAFIAFMSVMALTDQALRHRSTAAAATAQGSGDLSRREVLGTTGVVVVGVAAGLVGLNALIQAYLKRSNLAYEGMRTPVALRSPITPNADFYVVSKNALDPQVIAANWRLAVTGLVHKPQTWDYDQVRRLAAETRAITLECISNGTGDHLMSTAEWRGVTLQTVLAAAGGVQPSGKYVIFRSVDGFATSLPLADLLQARTLLPWQMNGQPLPDRHGFPLRVVVPGRYGEQSAKWLTEIEISDQPFKGFYQSQGWSDKQVFTISRIDTPTDAIPLAPVAVGGIALAGIRQVQRVEVSADNGQTWNDAQLTPPLSDQTWVFWSWMWTPPARGMYMLVVRATDGTGAVQTQNKQGVTPNGATGWHHVKVLVK